MGSNVSFFGFSVKKKREQKTGLYLQNFIGN